MHGPFGQKARDPQAGKSSSKSSSPKRRSGVRPKTAKNRQLPARWKESPCNAEAVMSRYDDRKGLKESSSGIKPPEATASTCHSRNRNRGTFTSERIAISSTMPKGHAPATRLSR